MRHFALTSAILSSFLFSACSAAGNVSEVVDGVKNTASGAINEAVLVKQRAEAEVKEVQERVDNVRDGMQKIQEGRELLRRGLTGTGS